MSENDSNQSEAAENQNEKVAPEPNEMDTLKAELERAKRDHLYLLAEFDNYRKNAIKERSDLIRYGSERFVRDFLDVMDNFDRALESEPQNESPLRKGVEMIAQEIKNLLQKHGVQELSALGETFDPAKHEALNSEPREDVPPGQVIRVFKKAYKMHDKLLRPAQVSVSVAVNKN